MGNNDTWEGQSGLFVLHSRRGKWLSDKEVLPEDWNKVANGSASQTMLVHNWRACYMMGTRIHYKSTMVDIRTHKKAVPT